MNRVVYFEIHCPDISKGVAFYEKVFGWKMQKSEGAEPYYIVTTGEEGTRGINGGMMASRDGQPRTVNTIEVEDVDQHAQRVTDAGGQVVVPKFAVPGIGWIVYCTDPGGNIFGIYKHDPDAT